MIWTVTVNSMDWYVGALLIVRKKLIWACAPYLKKLLRINFIILCSSSLLIVPLHWPLFHNPTLDSHLPQPLHCPKQGFLFFGEAETNHLVVFAGLIKGGNGNSRDALMGD